MIWNNISVWMLRSRAAHRGLLEVDPGSDFPSLTEKMSWNNCRGLSAVKCPLSLTVPLHLTAIFECQSFNTTIFCANTPWPTRLQPAAICVHPRIQSILLGKKPVFLILPHSQRRFVALYPITRSFVVCFVIYTHKMNCAVRNADPLWNTMWSDFKN